MIQIRFDALTLERLLASDLQADVDLRRSVVGAIAQMQSGADENTKSLEEAYLERIRLQCKVSDLEREAFLLRIRVADARAYMSVCLPAIDDQFMRNHLRRGLGFHAPFPSDEEIRKEVGRQESGVPENGAILAFTKDELTRVHRCWRVGSFDDGEQNRTANVIANKMLCALGRDDFRCECPQDDIVDLSEPTNREKTCDICGRLQ